MYEVFQIMPPHLAQGQILQQTSEAKISVINEKSLFFSPKTKQNMF